ncbi:MAG: (Fe-S)-binding protein [Desulfobulbaceae bacterium]|nr:MAG: (Fe-S)-binding protein [Desulfobulbaceae bacterium]
MNKNKELKDFTAVIEQCVKCGVCQAHCPTYQADKREGSVARGKIALAGALIDGQTELDEGVQRDITMCLMCGSCVAKCPSKVPTHEIVGAIRRQVTDNQGLSLIGKTVSTLLPRRKLLNVLTKSGALVSPLLLKKVPETSGLRLRIPSPMMKGRTVPKTPLTNLFDRVKEFSPGDGEKPTIGFFAGCAITYLYPEIGVSLVGILNKLGYSVYLPRTQGCCGIPALSSGNGALVEQLAERNADSFANPDLKYIITACGSCNSGIGEYYQSMKMDLEQFTSRVIDLSVFLQQEGLYERLVETEPWQQPLRVTYHDPCHLKSQGITKEPRELLKALPNVDFVEMEHADTCCGLGGTFSVHHYETSKKIGSRKLRGIEESGASLIATACPGCIMQLQDVINHQSLKVRAVHLLELLEQALGEEPVGG